MASRYPPGNHYGGSSSKENGNSKDTGKDNVFDLDSAAFASDEFRMNEFKVGSHEEFDRLMFSQVKRCPRARPHDWTQCPFAHPGEKARRRDPRRYKYSGTACPEFRKSGCCRRGDACPFAHGVFECWLHPSRYRTQLCTDGTNCKRRVCFFAHVESELRHPEDDPGVAQRQVQAELAAEVQTLQQQHLTQALQALLIQTTQHPMSAPERPPQMPALTLEMLKQNEVPAAAELMDDNSNSTAALQLALLQQLAAKEQQLQQSTGDKSNEVTVSVADNGFTSASSMTVHQPDMYDTLSQLKQLSLSAAAPIVSTPAVGLTFDPTSLLSQLMPNGTPSNGVDLHSHSLLIDSLLTQNGTKLNGHTRRSIDNSYLSSLLPDPSGQPLVSMGFPIFPNGGYHLNQMKQETAPAQIPVSNGTYPVVSSSQMYSVENIQRLMQNPAFSSNLSQLLQMNPSLLQQLTSNPTDSGNPGRHSIDNGYLTRLNTGFVHNGVGQPMAPTEQQPEPLLMNGLTGDGNKMMQGGITPDALLQGFNALNLQLSTNPSTNTGLSGVGVDSDGYTGLPPHSSPDSDANSSNGAHPVSQSLTEDH